MFQLYQKPSVTLSTATYRSGPLVTVHEQKTPHLLLRRLQESNMSQPSSSPIGNDPLDPNRLTLNNGIQQGDFFVGPVIPPVNATPVRSITEYLGKRDNNSETFVTLKVLQVNPESDSEVSQGKLLLHNEHLVLSLLQDQPGVIHHQGFFKDRDRFILVLDCLIAHNYDRGGHYRDYVNLQHYVINKKRLEEKEALELFYNVLLTVRALHKKNIVHRDLKLGNLVLNRRTRSVILTNFALSKHLVRSNDKLTDQRGSLAYVSPDVLSGRPYDGKASDMWALGVLLYTMLYGQFPFYDNNPQELFKKIKAADYIIPEDGAVKMRETTLLIRQLIEKDFRHRLTAAQTLDIVHNRLSRLSTEQMSDPAQVVPDSVVPSKSDDSMVPDLEDDFSPPTPSATHSMPHLFPTSSIDMNAVHLTLSPMLIADLDSHSGRRIGMPVLNTSPVHVAPSSPPTGPFVPYVLTDFPPSHAERPRALLSSHNPFLGQSSSPPFFMNTSPLSSLGGRPHSNSLPENSIHTTTTHISPLSSFPPLVCHRYPVAISLSGDSFFSPQSDSRFNHNPNQRQISASDLPPSIAMSLNEHPNASNLPPRAPDSRLSPNHTVMDSLVTIRPSRHSFSSGVGFDRFPNHSHNLSSDRLSPQHLVSVSNQTQRRRRNSSGTGVERVRRHSHQAITASSASLVERRRRRSHDIHAEQTDLLEGLRMASGRRTYSTPSSIPIRIQLSGPAPQEQTNDNSCP